MYSKHLSKISLILILFIASFLLRIPHLDKPLIKDEGRLYKCIKLNNYETLKFIVEEDSHPPLYYYFSKLWAVISEDIWWLRLLNVLLGSFSVVILYLIALKLFDEKIAIFAAIISIISPNLVFTSQFLRTYSLATFLVSLAIFSFVVFWEKRNKTALFCYAFFSLLSIYTLYYASFLVISLNLFFIFKIKIFTKKDILNLVIANLLIAALFLLWVPFLKEQMFNVLNDSGSHQKLMIAQRFGMYIGNFHLGSAIRGLLGIFHIDTLLYSDVKFHTSFNKYILVFVVLLIFVCGLVIVFKSSIYLFKKERLKSATIFLIFLIFGTFFLSIFLNISKGLAIIQRYMAPCALFSSIIWAGFFLSVHNKILRNILFAILAVFFAFRLIYIWSYNDKDFKDLVKYLNNNRRANVIISCEDELLKNKKLSQDFKIIYLENFDLKNLKEMLKGYDFFYWVKLNRPASLLKYKSSYDDVMRNLTINFKLVDEKDLNDLISIYLFRIK